MRVLVTGGAGYVGSHTVRELVRRGHEVVVYDNLSTGHRMLAEGFTLVEGDVGDAARLAPALSNVEAVLHFAAHAYVGESVENPRKYFRNNVESGCVFLNAVVDAGVQKFIFSSSCSVYGIPARTPITEDMPREPLSPYAASKLFFEHALAAYDRAYGLRYASLRYFNAAGADEGGQIGEWHTPETHLIPNVLLVAAGRQTHLDIFGNDYPTPDGTCIRDYIHVTDLANAHVLALEHLGRGQGSMVLNLGTGQGHSVNEVVASVEQITGHAVARRYCPRRPGDAPVLVADASRAWQVLGWQATRTLPIIVSSAWKWLESRLASK